MDPLKVTKDIFHSLCSQGYFLDCVCVSTGSQSWCTARPCPGQACTECPAEHCACHDHGRSWSGQEDKEFEKGVKRWFFYQTVFLQGLVCQTSARVRWAELRGCRHLHSMSWICTPLPLPSHLCSTGGHRVPGLLKVPSQVAHREEFLQPALGQQCCGGAASWGSGLLAGAGAQAGALCVLWLLGPASGRGAVPCGVPWECKVYCQSWEFLH